MPRHFADLDDLAQERLAADERRITRARRTSLTLAEAWRAFLRHPSPWVLGGALVATVTARVVTADYRWSDLALAAGLVAAFPLIEWVTHVLVLHWRPRRVGPLLLDSTLARKHRAHHADPRDIPLLFIPWQVLVWLVPAFVVLAVLAFPRGGLALTFLATASALACAYEWTHYLVHSDYRPRTRAFRAVWRNHRLHHYKNEHYWFAVATAGTADRLLGTYPDPSRVETSPSVRALHARSGSPAGGRNA